MTPDLQTAADAARQALLRRLAAPLKHDMVVNLQAVAMLTETLAARLERNPQEAIDFHSALGKLNRLARDAVTSCVKVASWLDAPQDDAVPLQQAVSECVALLSGNLNFRGFSVSAQVPESEFEVARSGSRNLLAAALLLLTDSVPAPGEVLVEADVSPDEAALTLVYFPLEPGADVPMPVDLAAAPLHWPQLEALAAAERAGVVRQGHEIVLRLPRARVTAPLQMAPI
jgi:hypothetical protein